MVPSKYTSPTEIRELTKNSETLLTKLVAKDTTEDKEQDIIEYNATPDTNLFIKKDISSIKSTPPPKSLLKLVPKPKPNKNE